MLFALKRYSQCSGILLLLIVPPDFIENALRIIRDIKCTVDKSATGDTLLFVVMILRQTMIVRYEAVTAGTNVITVFWDVTPYTLVRR